MIYRLNTCTATELEEEYYRTMGKISSLNKMITHLYGTGLAIIDVGFVSSVLSVKQIGNHFRSNIQPKQMPPLYYVDHWFVGAAFYVTSEKSLC